MALELTLQAAQAFDLRRERRELLHLVDVNPVILESRETRGVAHEVVGAVLPGKEMVHLGAGVVVRIAAVDADHHCIARPQPPLALRRGEMPLHCSARTAVSRDEPVPLRNPETITSKFPSRSASSRNSRSPPTTRPA